MKHLNYVRNLNIYVDYINGVDKAFLATKYNVSANYAYVIACRIDLEKQTLLELWKLDNMYKRHTIIRLPLLDYRILNTLKNSSIIYIDELELLINGYFEDNQFYRLKIPEKIGVKKISQIKEALDRYKQS